MYKLHKYDFIHLKYVKDIFNNVSGLQYIFIRCVFVCVCFNEFQLCPSFSEEQFTFHIHVNAQ